MYHIKSDKRSQASAMEIARGLQECLKTTPLKAITVSDLHRVTGISRATFYRLFDTPEDVLLYRLDQMTRNAVAYDMGETLSSKRLLESIVDVGLENHELLKALAENDRLDLLFRYTEENFRMLDDQRGIFPVEMEPSEREYIIAHLAMSSVATQITWARHGQRETAQDLVRYLRRYARIILDMLE